jgi:predicted transcriptional regulator
MWSGNSLNSPETKNQKELRRIDWNIIKKLLNILYNEGKMRKTILARKSNMGYDNCVLYIDWLSMLDLIRRNPDEERAEIISLSELGISFCKRKLMEGYRGNNSEFRNGMSQSFG